MSNKELEQLHKRRQKAQDQGDIAEEAKLCNAIGDLYAEMGNYKKGLNFHQQEITLSEAMGDQLGAAVAHRKVGECHCELGNYHDAIHHQKQHLRIARCLGDLPEEQRALATLGRTYFVYSQSEEERGKPYASDLLLKAEKHNLDSLDICDKLVGRVPDREILEMRSRLYLNLGLVYETQNDLKSARSSMEKALNIVKELGDSLTTLRCYYDLGSLHLRDHRPSLALKCFQQTLDMAKEQKNKKVEVDALREMAQAHLCLANLQSAKSCLKKALSLKLPQVEEEVAEKQLLIIRKILQCSSEVEKMREDKTEEIENKLELCEKLGDLCCSLKAYPAAIDYYGQQLGLAEAQGVDPFQLSPIYISLARTHMDCLQYPQALIYYKKELDTCCTTAIERCDTWTSIAKMHAEAGRDSGVVMEAYNKAAAFAKDSGNFKHQVDLHKSIVKFCRSRDDLDSDLSQWEVELSRLLEAHPELADGGSSDEEDSQGLDQLELSDAPSSLPSEDSEDEEEEGYTTANCPTPISMATSATQISSSVGVATSSSRPVPPRTRSQSGVVVRKKPKLMKRNEKGETLLHVAAIQGNLAMVKKLIREGADVNARDNCGWIPLHEACNFGHEEVVSVLLENGAVVDDPGGPDCGGVTPLIDASYNGHVDVVRLLVEKGANVMIKDKRGYTALDMLTESLSSKEESGQGYDLEEEHTAICELLRKEMRRRGYDPPAVSSAGTSGEGKRKAGDKRQDSNRLSRRTKTRKEHDLTLSQSSASSTARPATTSSSSRAKKPSLLQRGRYSTSLLYNSSEDEEEGARESSGITHSSSLSTPRPSVSRPAHQHGGGNYDGAADNPFENFTVGGKSSWTPDSIRNSESTGQQSKTRLPVSSTVSISVGGSRFNPLGQVEGSAPALIPESDNGGSGCERGQETEGDCPVIDNWLVDDMSTIERPLGRRKRPHGSSGREVRPFLEGNSSSSMSGEGRRKRPLQRTSRASSQGLQSSKGRDTGRCTSNERSSKKRKTDVIDLSSSDSDERFLDLVVATEDDLMDLDREARGGQHNSTSLSRTPRTYSSSTSANRGLDASNLSENSTHLSRLSNERPPLSNKSLTNSYRDVRFNSSTVSLTQPPTTPSSRSYTSTNTAHYSEQPPFRIKVKIESVSYLIPCPRKNEAGCNTTVEWLVYQASERHYKQVGARPRLRLTTSDGAILCPSDPIAHVISENEEVVGVVEEWLEATLEERYQAACRNARVEPNSKVLHFFRNHCQFTSLDVADLDLTAVTCGPAFQALGSHCHALSSLSLKGSQLGDAAMAELASSLSHVSTLSELNLSRTGITAQGVESLARFCPTPQQSTAMETDHTPSWVSLNVLNLSFNKLGVACGRGLAALLGQCKRLQELCLTSCRLGPGVFDEQTGVGEALKGLVDLSDLNLSLNPLGPESVASLLPSLPPQLSHLNLRETCKKNRPITEAMPESHRSHCWLESLDFSHCGVNDIGLSTLVNWLEGCGELKELKLAGSSISAAGVDPLCRYIAQSSLLQSVDVSGAAHLGNSGCIKVLQAYCCGRGTFENTGRRLCLKGCGMESTLPDELVDLLNSALKDSAVDMSGNKIDTSDKQKVHGDPL